MLPFACGLINLLVAANSYSPTITGSHRGGAVLFLVTGVLACLLGLARLISAGGGSGVLFGVLVLVVQLAMLLCVGLAAVGR